MSFVPFVHCTVPSYETKGSEEKDLTQDLLTQMKQRLEKVTNCKSQLWSAANKGSASLYP